MKRILTSLALALFLASTLSACASLVTQNNDDTKQLAAGTQNTEVKAQ